MMDGASSLRLEFVTKLVAARAPPSPAFGGYGLTLAATRPRRCIPAMITIESIRAKRRWSMS